MTEHEKNHPATPAHVTQMEQQNYNCPCAHPSQRDDSCMTKTPQEHTTGEPWGAYTIDYLGCEYVGCDIDRIKEIAAAGSKGPTEVVYLYPGQSPQEQMVGEDLAASSGIVKELTDALKDLVKAHRKARVELGYDEDGESDSIEWAEEVIAKAEGGAA